MSLQSLSSASQSVVRPVMVSELKANIRMCDLSDMPFLNPADVSTIEFMYRRTCGALLHDLGGLASAW